MRPLEELDRQVEHLRFGERQVVLQDPQLVLAVDDLHAKGVTDHAQVPVGRTEQGEALVRLFEGDVEVHERLTN